MGCHPERSKIVREAKDFAQSRDLLSWAVFRPRVLFSAGGSVLAQPRRQLGFLLRL